MAREPVRRPDIDTLRAADVDRHKIAEQLKGALDEGRLSLAEYDDRVRDTYAARTYADLLRIVADLPQPGLSAEEIHARQLAEQRRADRRMPLALSILWTIWSSLFVLNLVVWLIVEITTPDVDIYPWPVWVLVPGAVLGVTTIGVQSMRRRHNR
ncbi:DUF1707 SHOCT-like domain-containing protein [Symbioplanes lichenis]|uniref:DUF1707 SHOCT-like domain-containing protein n=1 Tax=Symbioplanes lichenis TaxID=1629072 RepID=UPI00273A0546|nr:DUF1707 domain-containing protein [Actinoplanes lichenis]